MTRPDRSPPIGPQAHDADERLSADDAAILALESSAVNGHTLKVVVLEPGRRPLEVADLRAHVAGRLVAAPRARQYVDIVSDGGPRWSDAVDFDIAAHVERYAGALHDDPDEVLREVAGSLMEQRLDHRRPLWHLELVGPFADGREAIVARIHHAMADGISAMRLLGSILWTEEPRPVLHPVRPPATPSSRPGPSRNRELLRLPGVVRRELLGRVPRTPLDQRIGSARSLAFSFLPLDELRRIAHGRQPRATVNDVLLSILADALPRWGPLARSGGRRLRAQIPVSLHQRLERSGHADSGNLDSFLDVDLPIDESDPLRCLDRIRDETARRKQLDDAEGLYDFFHAVSRFHRLAPRLEHLRASPHEWTVSISNVPGPSGQLDVMGRRVERLGTIAEPADHHALRIAAISSGDTLAVGLCTDPTRLADVGGLADAIGAAGRRVRRAAQLRYDS